MNDAQAHPFFEGGYPLFTNKFPPPITTLRLVVHPTRISPRSPLTFDSKTVSFMVYFPTSQEDHGHCKKLDYLYR